ncbi:hypothetical protein JA33_260 [Dickeya phage vB_DsoM_JA33]|uniref:Uncharacterized protein n=3 Tax=Salmondvirus JA11 TaxID=2734141 RepID=A0A384ZWS1_9CAUD|nr:hypothetical protein HOU32_gp259 [Dickeya phage vB_DsoM_JA11]AXG66665.1 hypothetical protein JA13_262 [Dickeya phage vB_DsoM_JA13]AXG67634.1 hypothetical protein JA33_260 [Dickeya phage vB_DsoM_JA33]AYD80064.1 hypothetical protein JA11_259 [Dickeya phage vB_DsoM_JA11]
MDRHCRAFDLIVQELKRELRSEDIAPEKFARIEKALTDLRDLHIYQAVESGLEHKNIALGYSMSTGRVTQTHNAMKRKFP